MITTLRTGALALTSAQYKFGADKNLTIRLTASAAHKLYGDVNITLANVLATNIFQKDGAMIENYFNRTLKFTRISATQLEFSEVIDRGIAASETFANLTNNGSAITATIANASFDLPAGTYNFLLLDSADSVFSTSKIQSQILDVEGTGEAGVARVFDQVGEGDFLSINGLDLQFSYPAQISLLENNAGITNIPLVINAESLSKVIPTPSQKAKTGQETSANSSPVVISSDQTSSVPAARNSEGVIVTPAQQNLFRTSFAKTLSGIDSEVFEAIRVGAGQTVAQSSGNLVVTTGTTVNSETILRSKTNFVGNLISRIQTILSQRIANQTFFFELVDVIGDDLVAVASSATSLTVTIPNNPFTSENIGQSMYVGKLSGGLAGIPNRYAIASVSGNNVTFTVSGFTISSGTVSLFGWNYYHAAYSGTVATNGLYDSQRKGWNSGDSTVTLNSTSAPGTMLVMGNEDGNAWIADQLVASSAVTSITQRGSRVINLPDEFTNLYFQIRVLNGSVAPASSTTLTVGTISVENYSATPVSSYNTKPQSLANVAPVAIPSTVQTSITAGQTAHSSPSTGNPVRIGGRVSTTLDTTLIQNDACDAFMTTAGQQVVKLYGTAENDWQYAAAAGGIVNTADVAIKTAGAANIRNYITSISIMSEALATATELVIKEGATVIFRTKIPLAGLPLTHIEFPTPLKGAAATQLNVALLTASATGAVYFNAQGYQSF